MGIFCHRPDRFHFFGVGAIIRCLGIGGMDFIGNLLSDRSPLDTQPAVVISL
jgi:hypothetical protein